ncbi:MULTISPECIES: hypothetical protein [unclassified Rhizobium]|uniref:hypothetical protein n=1 Tax=unclassified Rhizobium TaxID=2613769 RepID=UPI0006FD4ED7|nr:MULTISPECIES: hypothetical protein [unclassified Rhizobium]KQV36446.1 hypothetical protein ASC86_24730 [Rhizobium sp. Root1212]KRD26736.1 hypothetical protein ASE37_24645 [Rhizobium sp. Root268]
MAETNKFTSVFIASDFLATSQKEQDSNLRWLRDLFKRPISVGGGVETLIASSRWNEDFSFDRGAFFSASGLDVDLEETQVFFESTKISDRSVEVVKKAFPPRSLIVGYELSSGTREIISRAGLIYIDVWLHPVRFLDDLLLAFDSNSPELRERIASFEFPEEMNYVYADRIRVQMYRGKPSIRNDLKPKSALYIGQTLKDKAIASANGMLTLLQYKSEFERAALTHNHLYYSRHPFVKAGDEKSLSFARGFKNVSLTNHPTYMLLASDEIDSVLSISSSVVTEAKYFGKASYYLYRPPVRVYDQDGYSSILHNYLFSGFWRFVFSGGDRPDAREISFIDGRNKLRDMLSWYWGFRQIDRLESLYNNVSTLLTRKG